MVCSFVEGIFVLMVYTAVLAALLSGREVTSSVVALVEKACFSLRRGNRTRLVLCGLFAKLTIRENWRALPLVEPALCG